MPDREAPPIEYVDRPSRSPWVAQMDPDEAPRPLLADVDTDVAIVGAGIAGVATAFFTLRSTNLRVALIERDRVAGGATGRNAGQLTTYFERPLHDIVREHGLDRAMEAQAGIDDAHSLLDLVRSESGSAGRVERFTGHMGMFSRDQLLTHLRNNALRREGGIRIETCVVSADAPFVGDLPAAFDGLYSLVPARTVLDLLETDDPRYCAVLSDLKGCANGGVLAQDVVRHLLARYPDRFLYADRTHVDRIVITDRGATATAGDRRVTAGRVVLCTNGFDEHVVQDADGAAVELAPDQRVGAVVGFMAAFLEPERREPTALSFVRNPSIGTGDVPYVYVTRRTYDHPGGVDTLTCMGGPEHDLPPGSRWDRDMPVPAHVLRQMDEAILPVAQPGRPAGVPFDFQWQGLMGYNDSLLRVVGAHPRHPALLYNLACNGVGFLPSVYGGERVARLLAGERLPAGIFDPR